MMVWLNKAAVKQRRKRWLTVLAVLAAVFALFTAVSAWQGWFCFAPPLQSLSIGRPGSATERTDGWSLQSSEVDKIEARMQSLLADQNGLMAWYRLPGRTGQPPGDKATVILAADQLRYGQFLLEQKQRKAFRDWWTAFRRDWIGPDNSVYGSLSLAHGDEGAVTLSSTADWLRVNLLTARILAQSCTLWPDAQRLDDLRRLADAIKPAVAGGAPTDQTAVVPTAAPIPDPGATPTPWPTVTPTPAPDQGIELAVLRLASVDLLALQALSQLDAAWQAVFDDYLTWVLGGYLGDALPLYAWAWQPETGGYLPFQGSQPAIDTEEAILTILHLCEIGQVPQRSISWIRDQLYNHSALYVSYHTGQGTAIDTRESLTAYAMVARIARIIEDESLYKAATSRLLWHQATSQTSLALHAIFRQNEEGAIYVWAADNTWSLLALR